MANVRSVEQKIWWGTLLFSALLALIVLDSDIIHLNLAGTSVIVLSSLEATDALLEKRSSLYSDR
jgi:hypothetical protein